MALVCVFIVCWVLRLGMAVNILFVFFSTNADAVVDGGDVVISFWVAAGVCRFWEMFSTTWLKKYGVCF